jgi:hypothetical protein
VGGTGINQIIIETNLIVKPTRKKHLEKPNFFFFFFINEFKYPRRGGRRTASQILWSFSLMEEV